MLMKMYQKEIDGKTVRKRLNEIVIRKDGVATFSPTEQMVLADGWVKSEVTPRELPAEILLKMARKRKLRELYEYDGSEEVNDCVIVHQGREYHYWADRYERESLKGTVRDCMAKGRENYRLDLRDEGVSITLECGELLQMMADLEVYAVDCFNRTTDHCFAINACTTGDEADAYEFRGVGYPAKCRFEL